MHSEMDSDKASSFSASPREEPSLSNQRLHSNNDHPDIPRSGSDQSIASNEASLSTGKRLPLPPFSFGKSPSFPGVLAAASTQQQQQQHQQQQLYQQQQQLLYHYQMMMMAMMNNNGTVGEGGPTSPFALAQQQQQQQQQPFFPLTFPNNFSGPFPNNIPDFGNPAAGGAFYFVPAPALQQPLFTGPPPSVAGLNDFMQQDPPMQAVETKNFNSEEQGNRKIYYPTEGSVNHHRDDNFDEPQRKINESKTFSRKRESGELSNSSSSSKIQTKLDEEGKRVFKIDTIRRDDRPDRNQDRPHRRDGADVHKSKEPSGSKKPSGPIVAAPSRCLFVRNVSKTLSSTTISNLFSAFGSVAFIDTSKQTQRKLLFVTYNDIRDAKQALDSLQDHVIGDQAISVQYSLPRPFTGRRPMCTKNDFQGSLSIMMGDLEIDKSVSDEIRRIFGRFGAIRAYKSVVRASRAKIYISYYDCRDCERAVVEMDGARFRRFRLSVKLEWDHDKMHEDEQLESRTPQKHKLTLTSDGFKSKRMRTEDDSASAPLYYIDKQPNPQPNLEDLYKSPLSGKAEPERKTSLTGGVENFNPPPPLLSQMNALMESLHERKAVKAAVETKSFGNEFEIEITPSPPPIIKEESAETAATAAPGTAESVQRLAHLILQQNQGISSMY